MDSTVIQCRSNISPCNSSLQALMLRVTCLAVRTKGPFTHFPSSSFGDFSPNIMKPSPPLTSVSPLGWISKGTNSRMTLNSRKNPCKSLLNRIHGPVFHHLRHSVPSSWPKYPNNNHAGNICHLPLHLFRSPHGPTRTLCTKPRRASWRAAHKVSTWLPLFQATRNDAKWRAGNPSLSVLLVNYL